MAALTLTPTQKALMDEMNEMDRDELKAMRDFFLVGAMKASFVMSSSEKANPDFEKESVICVTFDDIEEAITKHTFSAPSAGTSTASQDIFQSFNYTPTGDEEEDDDNDNDHHHQGRDDDVSTIGGYGAGKY